MMIYCSRFMGQTHPSSPYSKAHTYPYLHIKDILLYVLDHAMYYLYILYVSIVIHRRMHRKL